MSLKKLGIALGAVLAIGALLASSAFASPVTNKAQWVNGAGETITGKTVTCAKAGAGKLVLKSTILGSPGEITAEQVECIGATIANTEVEGVHMATASGKLKFTGLTVVKPEGCTAEPVETVSISTIFWFLPSRMIEPLPKARSICDKAASSALVLSTEDPSTRRRLAWLTVKLLLTWAQKIGEAKSEIGGGEDSIPTGRCGVRLGSEL